MNRRAALFFRQDLCHSNTGRRFTCAMPDVSFKTMPFRPMRSPAGLKLGAGTAAVVAAVLVAAALPKQGRLAVVAGTTGLFGALALDVVSLAGVTVIAWLLVNGFLVNQLGVLTWHGSADLVRLGVLAGTGVVGLAVGGAWRFERARADRQRFDESTRQLLNTTENKEEWRDA
jgi:hypothetical protein